LVLEDGTVFKGVGFGAEKVVVGEVVFTTGMVGYHESLTDPSYRGQILCFTYPLIGNYGVPSYSLLDEYGLPRFFESWRIQALGIIIHELCLKPSHWRAEKTLNQWLAEEGVPGIYGVDTRMLTKKLRVKGVMMGALAVSRDEVPLDVLLESISKTPNYGEVNFVAEVSPKEDKVYGSSDEVVVLIDCGVKLSIIRSLLNRGFRVVSVPYNTSYEHVMSYNPLGVVISNGPGDPKQCMDTVNTVRKLFDADVPMLGICLGNQILALALGGDTYKLKYGHRGQNKPCINLETNRCYVTSQNHGYAVNAESLKGTGLRVWWLNADDKTVEGIKHEEKPCMAVQFHPEATPGPLDCTFIFDQFAQMVRGYA